MKELDRIAQDESADLASRLFDDPTDSEIETLFETIRSAIDQALALSREPVAWMLVHQETTERQLLWEPPKHGSTVYREDVEIIPLYATVHSTGVPSEQCASSKAGGGL